MILFIDSSEFEITRIALITQGGIVEHSFGFHNLSERLLPEIKKFLKKRKIGFKNISKLAVVTGPGGFSRIRTAVAVTNALALALNLSIVPVIKDKLPTDLSILDLWPSQKMVAPIYDREPNITLPKK